MGHIVLFMFLLSVSSSVVCIAMGLQTQWRHDEIRRSQEPTNNPVIGRWSCQLLEMKTAITKDCEDNNDSGVHPLIIRKLTQMDAPLVQAQWNQHTSSSSKNHKPLEEVAHRLIQNSKMCFGSFVVDNDDEGHNNDSLILCGFILQYDNGVIGMLHVEPEYRRRGHATALLEKSTHALFQERKATTITRNDAFSGVAYIMDGNDASEAVFSKQGWVKENPTIRKKTGNRRAKRKWILLNQDDTVTAL